VVCISKLEGNSDEKKESMQRWHLSTLTAAANGKSKKPAPNQREHYFPR